MIVAIAWFAALRGWHRDGPRARVAGHEQEAARGTHRLHPEGSDPGKSRETYETIRLIAISRYLPRAKFTVAILESV